MIKLIFLAIVLLFLYKLASTPIYIIQEKWTWVKTKISGLFDK